MSDKIVINDTAALDFEKLEQMVALNTTPSEIAIYFDVPLEWFIKQYNDVDSKIYYHTRRGVIRAKIDEGLLLVGLGRDGDVRAFTELREIRREKGFELSKLDLFGGIDERETMQKLEDYLQNGSSRHLTVKDELYLDLLTYVSQLERKYGRRNTVELLKKKFKYSYNGAREVCDEALNLFHSDRNTDKKALRNKKAEQLEEAAHHVLMNAKESKDYKVYSDIMMQAAKLQELDKPDAVVLPKQAYLRPVNVYVLDASIVGIPGIDRNVVAAQIDELNIPEMDKIARRREAMIEDIDFINMLDDVQTHGNT